MAQTRPDHQVISGSSPFSLGRLTSNNHPRALVHGDNSPGTGISPPGPARAEKTIINTVTSEHQLTNIPGDYQNQNGHSRDHIRTTPGGTRFFHVW